MPARKQRYEVVRRGEEDWVDMPRSTRRSAPAPKRAEVPQAFAEHAMDEATAESLGYSPLTTTYVPRTEDWMLANVITDMVCGGIHWCLVRGREGMAVWRKHMKKITRDESLDPVL